MTVTDVEDAVGYELAGVVYEGDGSKLLNGIGGFGVVVNTDPFSTTQVVLARRMATVLLQLPVATGRLRHARRHGRAQTRDRMDPRGRVHRRLPAQ